MRRAVLAVLVALTVSLAAGCGSASKGPGVATAGAKGAKASATPSASEDPEERQRKFVQCMREHGVDMPDPDPNGGPVRITASAGPANDDAMKACEKYLPAGKLADLNPEQLEKLRQFAQCMREHGIDVPDPDLNGGGLTIKKGDGPDKFKPDDPAFRAAEEACKDKLPGKIGTAK